MDPLRLLLRMRRLAQNPPSWGRVVLVVGVIAACLLLVAVEMFIGWPDWLTLDRTPRPPRF
ncbi:MAG: hypothetical protein KF887_12240 [Paracoccaceae bacterium]|nr:MAG: hypothetical protein KF887_12240 [Paracoccaceae bacterium]